MHVSPSGSGKPRVLSSIPGSLQPPPGSGRSNVLSSTPNWHMYPPPGKIVATAIIQADISTAQWTQPKLHLLGTLVPLSREPTSCHGSSSSRLGWSMPLLCRMAQHEASRDVSHYAAKQSLTSVLFRHADKFTAQHENCVAVFHHV